MFGIAWKPFHCLDADVIFLSELTIRWTSNVAGLDVQFILFLWYVGFTPLEYHAYDVFLALDGRILVVLEDFCGYD